MRKRMKELMQKKTRERGKGREKERERNTITTATTTTLYQMIKKRNDLQSE